MGHRREPRVQLIFPATLCGMDASGRPFLESATIHNISGRGVLLETDRRVAGPGDIVVLRYGQHKGRFRAMWAKDAPAARGSRLLGLRHLAPTTLFWGLDLPLPSADEYFRPRLQARRQYKRFSCELAVELRIAQSTAPRWSNTSNISEGGCFVNMLNVLPIGTAVDIGIWVGDFKIWASGIVVSNVQGFGIGIKFTALSQEGCYRLLESVEGSLESADRRLAAEQTLNWEASAASESLPVGGK